MILTSKVLERLWNASGDEEDISGDEFDDENDKNYRDESESSKQDVLRALEEKPGGDDVTETAQIIIHLIPVTTKCFKCKVFFFMQIIKFVKLA